jgi:hypothetical protein
MAARALSLCSSAFLSFCGLLGDAAAQCTNQWLPGFGTPGTNGIVQCMVEWDPDGAGPASPVIVVVGQFDTIADVVANNVATYDPATQVWAPLGAGVNAGVSTAVVAPWGELFIGGYFSQSGGGACSGIAKWTGTAWAQVGGGIQVTGSPGVAAVLPRSTNEIWIGGAWGLSGPIGSHYIAHWNNGSWSAVAGGPDGVVFDLASLANGDIVAAGQFQSPGYNIARWNGSVWSPVGGGLTASSQARDLEVLANGDLVVTGDFYTAGGSVTGAIARWNGSAWSGFGTPPFSSGQRIRQRPNGHLIVGSDGGDMLHEWDGTTWTTLGNGSGSGLATRVNAVAILPNSRIIAGGFFSYINGVRTANIAMQNATTWQPMATGFDGAVYGVAAHANGFVAGGAFVHAGSIVANFIAEWNGTTWQDFGGGMNSYVTELVTLGNGDLVASGNFSFAGTTFTPYIARWDGVAWHALGQGIGPSSPVAVATMRVLANGNLLVGGNFSLVGGAPAQNLAVWDGAAWQATLGLDGPVQSVLELQNGDWIVGGSFVHAGGVVSNGIARWNGTTWAALGTGVDWAVYSLAEMPNGDIVAGGNFGIAGGALATHIAKWNGTSWSPIGGGVPFLPMRLVLLPGGDLIAAGRNYVAGDSTVSRWNGVSWLSLGSGGFIEDAAFLPQGELLLAGTMITPVPTAGPIARLATNCPPSVASYGSSCVGSAGPVTLQATSAPWLRTTFRARTNGLPPNCLAVGVYGFSQIAVPLSSGHPQGLPGCMVLVADQILIQFLVGSGHVDSHVEIPNDPAMAGVQFYHQVVPIELDATGSISALTSSNALAATIGVF